MRVLVTFAVDAEFAPWRKLRTFSFVDYYGLPLWRTKCGNVNVKAILTGVGMEASAHAMGLMMSMADDDKYFDVCISSGLAGALCDTLSPGDIVAPQSLIAERAHQHHSDEELRVDSVLRDLALRKGAVDSKCLITADRLFVKASEKGAYASRAQSVDMESFEIIKEANALGARGVVIRAISDTANEDLPIDFSLTLAPNRQISLPKVLLQVAKHPLALPSLVRFGKQSRQAAERLTKFLDEYVEMLANTIEAGSSKQVAAR
jgi:nucleoside phosphorylase